MFNGICIIENDLLVDTVEDWSRVRSPSRARRRMRYGHKQNVKIITKPKMEAFMHVFDRTTFFMHPVMADLLRKAIRNQQEHPYGVGATLKMWPG